MDEYGCFHVEQHIDVTLLRLKDPLFLDRLLINALVDELLELIEERHPRKLLIDFGQVRACSSEVVGGLIRAWRRVAEDGGVVHLSGMLPDLHQLFRMLKLDGTVFVIHNTLEDGLRALA
jgi:anti-anti-sigma regulatory factor